MSKAQGVRRAPGEVLGFFGEAMHRCVLHGADTQSAALAFYAVFTLAPALPVVVGIAGDLVGEGRVHGAIVHQLRGVMGPSAAQAVSAMLGRGAGAGPGSWSGAVAAIGAFFLGAMAVFIQLQEALNRVWEVGPRPGTLIRSILKRRLVSFVLVLAVGLVLLVSLTLSYGLATLTGFVAARIPFPVGMITLGNEVLSFLVVTILIALIYRVLPDANLDWRDVGIGAVVTSTLFSIGKILIGLYLGWSSSPSRFGAAGALAAFLLWVYCESYVLLFGAEVTAVYSSRFRRHPPIPEGAAANAGHETCSVPGSENS